MHIVPYYLTYSRTNVIIVMLCVNAYGAMLYKVRCHVIIVLVVSPMNYVAV